MRSHLFPLFLTCWIAACGASGGVANTPPSHSRPELAPGDRSDESGSHFTCEGEGPDKAQALATAQGVCTDKVCRVCGVEVESVLQTTETLQGVSMQRKVVEHCRLFRKSPLAIESENIRCAKNRCTATIEVFFSKEAEARECAVYASEHFDDPAECERLIGEFRSADGRDANSFRQRTSLMNRAISACAGIDVRPTPLLEALAEQLLAGMDHFEFTEEKQQAVMKAYTSISSREDLYRFVKSPDIFLITPLPLRQRFRETKTLVGRLELIRDYVQNRALVFDVIEANKASDLDSKQGIARLLAALEAAPLGVQHADLYDVHMMSPGWIDEVRSDIRAIVEFYRRAYAPADVDCEDAIRFAHMMVQHGRVDAADWDYLFTLHRDHSCGVALITLFEVKDHGSPAIRDERFLAALDFELQKRSGGDAAYTARLLLPKDSEFVLHIQPQLAARAKGALDWEDLLRRVEAAKEADDGALLQDLLPALVSSLALPAGSVTRNYCIELGDRLVRLTKLGVSATPLAEPICSCLEGPLSDLATRSAVNKATLHNFALASWLPCVKPG